MSPIVQDSGIPVTYNPTGQVSIFAAMWLSVAGEPHCNILFTRSLSEANLDCGLAPFAVANAQDVFDLIDKNLSVSNLAGGRRRSNCLDHFFSNIVPNDHLDLDLGKQVNRVFAPPVYLGMAFLTDISADLGDGHSLQPKLDQSFFYCLESSWLDDCLDLFHKLLIS